MTDTTTALKVEDLIAEVRRLAAENPNFRYADYHLPDDTSCVYNATPGKPACIMGRALANLGHPVDPLYEGSNIISVWRGMNNDGEWRQDDANERWLREAQRAQDQGATWAEAVERADGVSYGV